MSRDYEAKSQHIALCPLNIVMLDQRKWFVKLISD